MSLLALQCLHPAAQKSSAVVPMGPTFTILRFQGVFDQMNDDPSKPFKLECIGTLLNSINCARYYIPSSVTSTMDSVFPKKSSSSPSNIYWFSPRTQSWQSHDIYWLCKRRHLSLPSTSIISSVDTTTDNPDLHMWLTEREYKCRGRTIQ